MPLTLHPKTGMFDLPVKRAKLYILKDKLTSFKMQEGESILEMFHRLQVIVNDLKSLGEKVNDEYVSYRFLRCLPIRFKTLVTIIVRGGLKDVTPNQVLGDVMREETYYVKDKLNRKLASFKMQEGESIPEMFHRLQVIVNDLKSLGEKVNDDYVSYRFLRCLPPRFNALVTIIVRGGLKDVTPNQVLGDVMIEETYHREREGADQEGEKKKKSVPFKDNTSSPKSKGKKKKEESNKDEDSSSNDEDIEEMALFVRRLEKFMKKKGYDARRNKLSSKGKKERRCFKCKSKDHLIADCAYNSDDEKNVKKEKDKESKKMILKKKNKGHSYCVTWDSDASSSDDDDDSDDERKASKKKVIAINTKPSFMMLHGQGWDSDASSSDDDDDDSDGKRKASKKKVIAINIINQGRSLLGEGLSLRGQGL